MNGSSDPVRELVELLDLERLDVDLFRGSQPNSERARVYGGQVAAQALIAGTRTVDPAYSVHSLHSYFLRGGDYGVPIVYDVERLREGRSFQTRRVVARQHGRPIYYQTLDLQVHEDGLEHQDTMPEVPAPEAGVDLGALMRAGGSQEAEALAREWAAVEARHLGTSLTGLPEDPAHPSRARIWARLREGLPDDPTIHLAAFTYASDITLLGASLAAHVIEQHDVQMASLDHTLWFHRPFRADQWWLYDQVSPSAQGGRGLSLGRVFTQDGILVATAAQEGLIRPKRPR
ncbi:acyl-CoA thioesterase [Nocardioides pantholopis]|uniref:acyl-CoA thioesterase n=1 Tax=Nocardioides pantholopis TaxID=2483798 RepID=UPI000F097253|nr:acyl-CoA thioesterase II [Nocardioides pantholopis]